MPICRSERRSSEGGRILVPGTAWPEYQGRPQSFIAQIDLSDVAAFPGAERLPSSGLLSFFFDSAQQAWGFAPEHRGGCRVLYSPPTARLQRSRFPPVLEPQGRFSAHRLRAEAMLTYPPLDSADVDFAVPELELDGPGDRAAIFSRQEAYAEVYSAFQGNDYGTLNRLLGHPVLRQGDMQRDAQCAYHGVPPFDPSAPADPRREQLEAGARCWRLLLQIDTVDDAGMMWGDVGCIYFLIRDVDLAAHDFEQCWPIPQCG